LTRRPAAEDRYAITSRRGASPTITGLSAAAVTFAVLELLQRVLGAFEPRPEITGLLVVAVGAASFALEALRKQQQERRAEEERSDRLDAALRCWPPPALRDADPGALGVFPPRRDPDAPAERPYVGRRLDDQLRAALTESRFVLVYGPSRSGKSRTALEAARQALPDARVLVPRDAKGLRELMRLAPPLDLSESAAERVRAVLWLDGLERFLDAVDGELLDDHPWPEGTVVATIRMSDYDEVLSASGRRGEAAKAIAARARAFELPRRLDPADELPLAERLYPGRDFRAGLGAALAATGKEPQPPPARPAPEPPATTAGDGRLAALRDGFFAVPAALAIAALAGVGLVWATAGFSVPSIGEQVEEIKREAQADDRRVSYYTTANFHGSGEPSHVFVFQVEDFYQRYYGPKEPGQGLPPSDELRVYDERGTELEERFRFQPTSDTAVFKRRFVGDLDDNGQHELIGGFGIPNQASEALLPFTLQWDAGDSRYELDPLLTRPPRLQAGDRPRNEARPFLAAYRTPLALRDARHRLQGYRAQDFVVTSEPDRIVTALVIDPRTPSKIGRVQVGGSIIYLSGDRPELRPCRFADRATLTAPWSTARLLEKVLPEEWGPFIRRRECIPG
jgi:hypothetical protein